MLRRKLIMTILLMLKIKTLEINIIYILYYVFIINLKELFNF